MARIYLVQMTQSSLLHANLYLASLPSSLAALEIQLVDNMIWTIRER